MSRSITIGYRHQQDGPLTKIEIRPPYYLLGCQETSIRFWSIRKLKEVGITQLTELGVLDPIYFVGWEMMDDLNREIGLLRKHLHEVDFYPEVKAQWLSHFGVPAGQIETARPEALVWALERGSRSGRVAYQFARDYAGRRGA